MRILLLAIWLGCLGALPAAAQENKPAAGAGPTQPLQPPSAKDAPRKPVAAPTPADVKVIEALLYYYVRKDPASIPILFEALRDDERMARTGLSRAVIAGFLSMVFVQNRSRIEEWVGNSNYPNAAKSIIEFSLWQSGNSDQITAIFHERPDFMRAKAGNLYSLTPRSAVEMDLKWGAFYATGNPGFVTAMVDAIDKSRPLTGSRELDNAIRKTSTAGLAINMRQHELIERFVRQKAADATGDYKAALNAMLAARQAEIKPAEAHDGDFSAQIAAIKLPEGIDKPEARLIDPLSVGTAPVLARRGETVGVTVVFSGMTLAEDLSADVSLDIKVTRPDGTVDSQSEARDLRAIKEKVPARFNALDSQSTLSIRFEPEDKAGPYRVDVILKDNIGGRKVSLSRAIQLID